MLTLPEATIVMPFGAAFFLALAARCFSGGHGSLHAVQQVQSDLSSRSCWLVAENGSKATGCSWFNLSDLG
jgi:hypothetical protein